MNIYFVIVRPNSSSRYTDSTWVDAAATEKRRDNLLEEFVRRGYAPKAECVNDGWAAWVSQGVIEDARLVGKRQKAA